MRGLAAKKPVPGVRLDRAALHAEVARLLADESPTDAIAGNTDLLFALDTVPASFDLQATLLRLYASELAGFYDAKLSRMVLATDLGEQAERMTLYHELVHALQDQHFDLSHAFDWQPEATDAQAALHALAEGDATAAMTEVFAAALGVPAQRIPPGALKLDATLMQASPNLRDVPGVIARSMIAPYADGLAFVTYLREHSGGWGGVDAAFRRTPVSTEQLLHPDKYVAGEPVAQVAAPEPPSGFEANAFRDVMGEQGLRMLFEDWLPAPAAAKAASDWGADRLAVFSAGAQRVVRWHLVFDNDAAARRALEAFARGAVRPELGAAYEPLRAFAEGKVARSAIRADQVCQARTQRGAFAASRHGRHVGVWLGPFQRTAAGVLGTSDCTAALAGARATASAH
ncbi:MAG TPA: hypothetical protein VFQ35_06750 [Polyangiaceae bacterium]|nr:hypothetical protein [Polyangiaceae bacterium]